MIGIVKTAWLFTRGSESVRIVRVGSDTGPQRLLVNGPGSDWIVHDLDDAADCTRHQSSLERRLVLQGYRLESFASGERRRCERRATPRGSDRRHLTRVV
jgi:hypothetical protein